MKKNFYWNEIIFFTVKRFFYGYSQGKKYRQIRLQRLQKVRIWAFGSLVHQSTL